MKRLILILTILFSFGCAATASPNATYEAIYLVQENGQLFTEDLQTHPEVMVTRSFDKF